jgi:hypothetical protein
MRKEEALMETAKTSEGTTEGGMGDPFTFSRVMFAAYTDASQAAARGAGTLVEELTDASRTQMEDLFAAMDAVAQCDGPNELIEAQQSYRHRSSGHLLEATSKMPALIGETVRECWASFQVHAEEGVSEAASSARGPSGEKRAPAGNARGKGSRPGLG